MVEEIKASIKQLVEENEGASSFAKIVPSIVKKGIDNVNLNMFDENTRNGLLNAAGDEFVKRGDFVQAVKSFVLTKNVSKLNEVGDIFSGRGQYAQSVEIYNLAYNFSQDPGKLIKCGERCLQEARLSDALRAFSILKDEPKLVKLGDRCLNNNRLSYAARAYELAGDKEKLSHLGDVLLKSGLIGSALRIYESANNQMMVEFIKENFSEDQFSKFYA